MGFVLNIKCVISKFTIVEIMWNIFRFSWDIAVNNLWYSFLKLMAANVCWHQWLCTITRFTVVITFLTGICSTDRWHRSLNFINIFMDYMSSSALYTSTVFFNNDTHVGIELIKVRIHLTPKFIKMRLLRKTLVFDGWTNTNQIVTFIGLRIRDMLPGSITENWYGGNNVIPNVSVTIGMRMGIRIEIYNTRFRMISAFLTQFSTGTVLVETSLLMKWSCVMLTDGNDWPCKALLVSNWVNSLLTDGRRGARCGRRSDRRREIWAKY